MRVASHRIQIEGSQCDFELPQDLLLRHFVLQHSSEHTDNKYRACYERCIAVATYQLSVIQNAVIYLLGSIIVTKSVRLDDLLGFYQLSGSYSVQSVPRGGRTLH